MNTGFLFFYFIFVWHKKQPSLPCHPPDAFALQFPLASNDTPHKEVGKHVETLAQIQLEDERIRKTVRGIITLKI